MAGLSEAGQWLQGNGCFLSLPTDIRDVGLVIGHAARDGSPRAWRVDPPGRPPWVGSASSQRSAVARALALARVRKPRGPMAPPGDAGVQLATETDALGTPQPRTNPMNRTTVNTRRRAPRGARTLAQALSSGLLAAALAGCATSPPPAVPGTVEVCAASQCGKALERYSAEQLAQGLGQLLQLNDGAALKLCAADPKTRECIDDDIGYFVLGGILPGRGSARSATMSQVQVDAQARAVRYVMAMTMRFLGVDLSCAEHDALLTVHTPDSIQIVDSSYGCTWLVMGIMGASFGFAIDSIDFDRGRLGGRWNHSVAGTGNGRGQGYAVIEFPKALGRDAQAVALR